MPFIRWKGVRNNTDNRPLISMKIYQLYRRQYLNLSPQEAWEFFSSPYNLNDITPEFFHVSIISKVPEKIYAGLMLNYQMKAVFGIPMIWLSEISHCDEPKRFVYEQRIGPFKFWSHEPRKIISSTKNTKSTKIFKEIPICGASPKRWRTKSTQQTD